MKSTLFLSLSVISLLGISSVSSATLYINGHDKDGNPPKSDCLEMMCENGCVEEGGPLKGHCCPNGGSFGESCKIDGVLLNECCQRDKGLLCSDASDTCICPTETPYWNGSQCVQCLNDESSCKKCGSDYRWYYPGDDSLVNGNPCEVCNGHGGSKTLSNGQNKQSDGRCCVGGTLVYNDSYCPGCKDITLGNRYEMSCYWYGEDCVSHFGWSDTRTIEVVERNMTLTADVLHIVNFSRYTVKDETTGSYLVNMTSLSWNSNLDSTVTLLAGHTYTIDLDFENLCEHCSVAATCN